MDDRLSRETAVQTASAQYRLGMCFSSSIVRAASTMDRFLLFATPFPYGVYLVCIPSFCKIALNTQEKYSFKPSDRSHLILQFDSFSTRPFRRWKHENSSLFSLIGKIQVCLKKSSIKVTKYILPPVLSFCAGPHTLVWIRSRRLRLFGNGRRCCFPC